MIIHVQVLWDTGLASYSRHKGIPSLWSPAVDEEMIRPVGISLDGISAFSVFDSVGWVKFHYAIQLASRSATSLRAASELEDLCVHIVCVSQAKFHYAVQLASRMQTSSRPNSITLSTFRPAREQLDGRRPATARRPASVQDSVMEFGRELVCILLASWTA